MDALVEHLLADIAIEGERGMTLSALEASLLAFEEARAAVSTRPAQKVDEAYTNYVWRQMRKRRDVRVGAYVAPERQAAAMVARGELNEGMLGVKLSASVAPGAAASPPPPPKAAKRQERPPVIIGTVDVDEAGKSLDIADLKAQHGDALRFTLDDESLRKRLWGSDPCAPLTWGVVQLAMRARERGLTFQEVGQLIHGGVAVMDSKTIFYHFKRPLLKEIVVKYTTILHGASGGNSGSAVVASRFKDRCAPYLAVTQGNSVKAPRAAGPGNDGEEQDAQDMAEEGAETTDAMQLLAAEPHKLGQSERERFEAEPEEEPEEEAAEDGDVKRGSVARAQASVVHVAQGIEGILGFAPLSPALEKLLLSRHDLMRLRVARLCEASTNGLLLRTRLAQRLGLTTPLTKRSIHVVSSAWSLLQSKGLLELVEARIEKQGDVKRETAGKQDAGVPGAICLRLTPAGEAWLAQERRGADERANDQVSKRLAAELERHRKRSIAIEVPFERQVLELVCAAGTRGTTLVEIQKHFGSDSYSKQRAITAVLTSMQLAGPSHAYDDTMVVCASDRGSGRIKEMRYWSRPAHLALTRQDALFDEADVAYADAQALHGFTNATPVEEWTDIEARDEAVELLRYAEDPNKPARKSSKPRINPIDPVTGRVKIGRPRKSAAEKATASRGSTEKEAARAARAAAKAEKTGKKIGRPKKVVEPDLPPPEPKKRGRPRKADWELSAKALARRKRIEAKAAAAAATAAAAGPHASPEDQLDNEDADSTAAVQALLERDEASPAEPSHEVAPVEPPPAPVAVEADRQEEDGDAAEVPLPAKRAARASTGGEPQERRTKRARRSKQVPSEAAADDMPEAASASAAPEDVEMPAIIASSQHVAPSQPIEAPPQPAEAAASADASLPEQPDAAAAANVAQPARAADTFASEQSPAPATPRTGIVKSRKSQLSAPANHAKRRRAQLLAEFMEKHQFVSAMRAMGELRDFLSERGEEDVHMFDDLKTRRSTFAFLEERGTVKSTTLAVKVEGGSGATMQQVIYYRADTSDTALAKYAKEASKRGNGPRPQRAADTVTVGELDLPGADPRSARQLDPFLHISCEDLLRDPRHRKRFDDQLTRSQMQGYVAGGLKRLQVLHLAVMAVFDADNSVEDGDETNAALVSHADGIIDVEQLRVASLTVDKLFMLVPSSPSPELTEVVDGTRKKSCTAAELGGAVEALARQDSSREAIDALLRDLELLELAQPVRIRKGGKAVPLPAGDSSQFWQFERNDRRLVGHDRKTYAPLLLPTPLSLTSVEKAQKYWALFRRRHEVEGAGDVADQADVDPDIKDFVMRQNKKSVWSRNYVLSALQKRFLTRFETQVIEGQMPEQLVRSIAEVAQVPLYVAVQYYLHKPEMKPLDETHPLFDRRASERAKAKGDTSTAASAKESRAALVRQREERRVRSERWDAEVAKCLADAGILPDDEQHELLTLTLYDSQMRRSWIKNTEDVQLDMLAQVINNAKDAPVSVKGEGAARRQSEAQAKAARKRAKRAVRDAEAKAAQARAGGKRKRAVRSSIVWTADRDEWLRDAVAVIRVRDAERGRNPNGREQMTALLQMFPEHQMQHLSTRLRLLSKTVGEEAYMDELQRQWTAKYKELRDQGLLDDGDWDSPDAFDLVQHVAMLRKAISKDDVQRNTEECPAEPLPLDTAPLREELEVGGRLPADLPAATWDAATTHDIAASAVVRTRFLKGQPFTLRLTAPSAKPISSAEGVARAIVRMHLDMHDEEKNSLVSGMESMAVEFGGGIDKAIEDLVAAKQIRLERAPTDDADLSTMRARRPGSNYVWCAEGSAIGVFGELDFATVAHVRAQAERKPLTEVRPDLDDNEAAALVMLLSEHRIAPAALNLRQLGIATRPRFNAKRLTDEELEMVFQLAPLVKPEPAEDVSASSEPPEHAVLAWCADGEEDWGGVTKRISKAWTEAARKSRRDGALVGRLARLLEEAGEAGATREKIEAAFAGVSQAQMQRVMRVPLHAEPPLAFFAGYDEPRLVHAQHLQAWTVRALSPDAVATAPEPETTASGRRKRKKSPPQPFDVPTEAAARAADAATANLLARARTLGTRFFPRVWLTLRGERGDKGRWQQGVRSVVCSVLERPGLPLAHLVSLFAQPSRTGLAYDRIEVSELLAAACATGVLALHIVRADGLRSTALSGAPEELFLAPHTELCIFPTGRDMSSWAAGGLQ